jgi:hypothetical protein
MSSRSMLRVERAATSLPGGAAVLNSLKRQQASLVAAAREGRPPVAAISETLLKTFKTDAKEHAFRQFVGLAVRAILEDAGFEVARTGVRLHGDPIFTTGAVYKKIEQKERRRRSDLPERLVNAFSPEEARQAFAALLIRFPELAGGVPVDGAQKKRRV